VKPISRFTQRQGVKLHALDFPGSDPALVIVPGITSPAATWSFVVRALEVPNRILILDNRGRGDSDKPSTGYSTRDYAEDLRQWCRALPLTRPWLLGHSMGARGVSEFDANWPDTAGALVVVESPLSGPGRAPYPVPLDFFLDQLKEANQAESLESLQAAFPSWTEEQLHDRLEWLPTCSETAIRESHQYFHREGFFPSWRRVSAPRLFVRGEMSPVVLATAMDEVRRANLGGEFEAVPRAGHMIPWDNLEGFVQVVKRFVLRQSGVSYP
jgi:N-formylmaleamate deformylase